jgi:hypothetical protein
MRCLVVGLLVSFVTVLHAQNDPVLRVRKPKSAVNSMPHIAGVYTGEISVGAFCSGLIKNDLGWVVSSFVLRLEGDSSGDGRKISGNKIPSSLCEKLQYIVGLRVFITEIIAFDGSGTTHVLPNMSFLLINN